VRQSKGWRGIEFTEFVEFLEFIGLRKQECVESFIPLAEDNPINTTNTRNTINKMRVASLEPLAPRTLEPFIANNIEKYL
jgi:hypothetical protein